MKKSLIESELETLKRGNSNADVMEALGKQTQLLLEAADTEDKKIMADLGLNKNVIEIERQRGINLERAALDIDWDGKVFSETEVKELCLGYNLRLLPIGRFIGAIDGEVVTKIKEFCKAHPETVTTRENHLFLVMAPKKCFTLDDPDKTTWTIKDKIREAMTARDQDPVLFYKVRQDNGYPESDTRYQEAQYKMIHQWGNEFTVTRKAFAWRKRDGVNSWLHWALLLTLMFMCIAAYHGAGESSLWCIPIGILLSSVGHGIYCSKGCMNRNFMDSMWDSKDKW